MKYRTTRTAGAARFSPADVILRGLAPDGGLFMPDTIPALKAEDFLSFAALPYPALAAKILAMYFDCFSEDDLRKDAEEAYGETHFPLRPLDIRIVEPRLFMLELWHGPTCAFKDMALQMMPRLLSRTLRDSHCKKLALIATATSGDTGKAAMEGFRDVPGIKIKVYFPKDGVSRIQYLQMATQRGSNVSVSGIDGNFDDAQSAVKAMFADKEMAKVLKKEKAFLTSANSINFARLAPQIVYYVYAYARMLRAGAVLPGEKVDVVVPSGNFGDIFSAYLAKRMGIPFGRLVVASNKNKVLADFFETGVYDCNRPFYHTSSPSMDILRSSNLERLLFMKAGPKATAQWMEDLKRAGRFCVPAAVLSDLQSEFCGIWVDEDEVGETIRSAFQSDRYLIDPHTAVGVAAFRKYSGRPGASRRILVASTASPFKFPRDVLTAIAGEAPDDDMEALRQLEKVSGLVAPSSLRSLADQPLRFTRSIGRTEMTEDIRRFLCE